jgi:hypothetical protein
LILSRRFWSAPRLYPGETIVCLGSGPSLNDVELSAIHTPTIAVCGAFFNAPKASFVYFGDYRWWRWYKDKITDAYAGRVITSACAKFTDGRVLRMDKAYETSLSLDPTSLAGLDSGYQAVNLAAHMVGPGGRIVLAGYDMGFDARTGASHCHEPHPEPSRESAYTETFAPAYAGLVTALGSQDIELVRITPSNLTCVPLVSQEEALCR